MSKMAHSHDWVSVESSAGGRQLECYSSLYMALFSFKKEHCVCIKPEAADLLEFIRIHLKKIKIGKILCSHFNIEDGRKSIWGILCFIISRKPKHNLNTHNKDVCHV